jgi:cytochrome c oxidase subunit II
MNGDRVTTRGRVGPALAVAGLALSVLALAGCGEHVQSALDPRGPQASRIYGLWWLFIVVSVVVQLGVTIAVFLALFRPNRRAFTEVPTGSEPGKVKVVAAFTAVTVLILVVFVVYSVHVSDAMSQLPGPETQPVVVEVVGHQWWWEVRYLHVQANYTFTTANELRIPVGRPVILRAMTRDVIHSFWVPNLHGKIDMVPGRVNTIWFQADEPGEYRGQCAEFCGLQHAKMAFVVVAQPEHEFEAWVDAYRQPAHQPTGPEAIHGQQVFLQTQCSLCHTVRGTTAWGRVGPDLTRLGARRTLAAGTFVNNRGNLAAWLVDPQSLKPGSFMPPTNLAPEDLQALLTYLQGLQ